MRITATEVDVLQQSEHTNAQAINKLVDDINMDRKIIGSTAGLHRLEESFHIIERPVRAFCIIAATLPQHKLNPAFMEMVDLPAIWEEFREEQLKRGWIPAVDHYYHLLQLDASFWVQGSEIMVGVGVPMRKADEKPWDLYKYRPIPFYFNDTVIDVEPQRDVIAHDATTGNIQIWQPEQLDRCVRVSRELFCHQPTVTMVGEGAACLAKLWRQDAEGVRAQCPLTLRQATPEARVLNETHFVTVAPEPVDLQIHCGLRATDSFVLEGFQVVKIQPGCVGVSSFFTLMMPRDKPSGPPMTVTVKDDIMVEELQMNDTTMVKEEHLTRPLTIRPISNEVHKLLHTEKSHAGTWILIGLSIAAICFIAFALLIGYLYVRRRFSMFIKLPNVGNDLEMQAMPKKKKRECQAD